MAKVSCYIKMAVHIQEVLKTGKEMDLESLIIQMGIGNKFVIKILKSENINHN